MARLGSDATGRRLVKGVGTAWGPLVMSGPRRRAAVPPSLEHLSGFVLLVAAAEIEDRYARAVEATGISLRDFVLLAEMAKRPGISQSALARRVGLSRARVSEQLAVLDTAGYVRRDINSMDLRRRQLYMAYDGQELIDECAQRLARVDQAWLSVIGVRERPFFTACLRRLPPADIGRAT